MLGLNNKNNNNSKINTNNSKKNQPCYYPKVKKCMLLLDNHV